MRDALVAGALALAAPLFARASEDWFGLSPCELCLWQRWPYWAAAGFALLAAVGPRWLLRLAAAAAAVSALIGLFHMGVEFHWWPSPLPGCSVPTSTGGASLEDLMATLRPAPTKPCDEPAFLIPGLPLSMAAMNAIYGASLAALNLFLARRSRA